MSFSRSMSPRPLLLLALTAALAARAQAQITHLEATSIDGSQEVPPVVTGASGRGDFTVNTSSHVLKYNVSFQNLSSAQVSAHIHQGAVGVGGPIIFVYPNGSPISGSFATTAGQEATLLSGGMYTNIHTQMHGGGEIRGQMTAAPAIGTSFCFGDGTGAPCPCLNSGAAGHGCENSSATGGALLSASGHNSPDNVVLISTGEKPTAFTLFIQGTLMVAPANFGDGLRCVGGQLKRLAGKNATGGAVAFPEGAEISITARSAALGDTISPGETRWYLAYYRDPDANHCPAANGGGTFNSSNSIEIQW